MASTGFRSLNRASLSSLRSFVAKSRTAAVQPSAAARSSSTAASSPSIPHRPFASFARSPAELGCCSGSLFPLHSAVAAARLTSCLSLASRSCRALSQGTLYARSLWFGGARCLGIVGNGKC